jgi:hypothetical protein
MSRTKKIYRENGVVTTVYNDKEEKFSNPDKKIYLPHELDLAIANHLIGENVIIIGMNGYSYLSEEKCRAYGVLPGAYEYACASFLYGIIMNIKNEFPGANIRLVHGSSNVGIDKVIINVAHKLSLGQLGFSCPAYAPYILKDDGVPVCVLKNEDAYCNAFTESLDILIGANGRKVAFSMDIDAVFKKFKHVIPINIIQAISSTGGPPGLNENGEVEDAVALYFERMHSVYTDMFRVGSVGWETVVDNAQKIVRDICRVQLHPSIAYNYSPHLKNW